MKSPKLFHAAVLASILFNTASTQAEVGKRKHFGAKSPFVLSELPNGKLKNQIKALPKASQKRAMNWLHKFTFPANDIAQLNVDKFGNVFYQEPAEITANVETNTGVTSAEAIISSEEVFTLHSKPSASKVLYLNFKGEAIVDSVWNDSFESDRFDALPFDLDGDNASYSDAERKAIHEVWHRVAEDLAPFDINVTTERPAAFGPTTGQVVITGSKDASGQAMPGGTGGGYAYVSVFGLPNYEWYQPALVYYQNLSSPTSYAEASTHEFGHHLGLSHHGTSTKSYYYGHGSGLSSWAPIMGVGYNRNVTQWSNGNYADANNTEQDDLAVLADKLSYSSDDHSDSLVGATPLLVDNQGQVISTNPQTDPDNQNPDNKGIIGHQLDSDVFSFDTNSGKVQLNITPAWNAFTRDANRGVNLDVKVVISDDYGVEIISDDLTDTNAILDLQLNPGRYYLTISGAGNSNTPYNDYASMGQYYISGSIDAEGEIQDLAAPIPNIMGWAQAPNAINSYSISMQAISASDDSGVVEYQFICTSGGANCVSSQWQVSTNYTATALSADTDYSFQVKARDKYGNETSLSTIANSRTYIDTNTAPNAQADSEEVLISSSKNIDVLNNDSDLENDQLTIIAVTSGGKGYVSINPDNTVNYAAYNNKRGGDSFTYTVSDGKKSATATVTISLVRSLSDGGDSGGDSGDDSSGGGKCHPKRGC